MMKRAQRNELWLVVGLTAVAALLRWLLIDRQSLWLDELFSVFLVRKNLWGIVQGTAQDILPPLYYLLLKGMMQFGQHELGARALSSFVSILTIPVFYKLGNQLFEQKTSLVATAFLAINPFHLIYAQEARMYTLFGLLSLWAAWFFWRAWHEGRRTDWTVYAITAVLALYTHSMAFLFLLALNGFVLVQRRHLKTRWRAWLTVHLVIGAAFLPWALVILRQTTRLGSEFAAGGSSPLNLFTAVYRFLFGNTTPVYLYPILLSIMVTLIGFGLLSMRYQRSASQSGLLFALLFFAVPVLGLYLISLSQPIFVERRLLPASFGLYYLIAWIITHAKPRRLHQVLGVFIGIGMIASLPGYFLDPALQKIPMRDVARTVAAQIQPGDTIIHLTDTSALAFEFYEPQLPNHFLAGDPNYLAQTNRGRAQRIVGLVPQKADEVVTNRQQIWLIVTLDHEIAYQKQRVAEFDAIYKRQRHQTVGGVDLLLYTQIE